MNESRFVRMSELVKIIGVSKCTLWRWRQAGVFPNPVHLGPRLVAWKSCEVDAWMKARAKTGTGREL